MLRILLFLGTNIAIMLVLSISLSLLGINGYLKETGGIDMTALLIFSAVFGMGGSFISLALSKWMAKKSMGVRLIESPQNPDEQWL